MSLDEVKDRLETRIKKLEAKLEKLRAYRDQFDDPVFVGIFDEEGEGGKEKSESKITLTRMRDRSRKPNKSIFSQVEDFLNSRSNEPASVRELCAAIPVEPSAMRGILYGSQRDKVERIQSNDGVKFRLATHTGNPV